MLFSFTSKSACGMMPLNPSEKGPYANHKNFERGIVRIVDALSVFFQLQRAAAEPCSFIFQDESSQTDVKVYPSYERFKEIIRVYGIKGQKDYLAKRKAVMENTGLHLPVLPNRFYGEKWRGWRVVTDSSAAGGGGS